MAAPTTSILLNSTTPAAPAGNQNVKPQTDGATPLQSISLYPQKATSSLLGVIKPDGTSINVDATGTLTVPTGGVASKTANYAAVAGDMGKLLVFNSASAVTLTLPAAPPFASWWIAAQNIGAGALTINRNGLTIDGAASNLTLSQNSGCDIYTDGTNYFTERGVGAVTSLTTTGSSGAATLSGGVLNIPNYSGGGGGSVPLGISSSPDWPPASPTIYDDEFTGGSLAGIWSWVSQGTATATFANSYIGLTSFNVGGGALIVESLPAAPWEFTMGWFWNGTSDAGGTTLFGAMVVRESSSGKFVDFQLDTANLSVGHWSAVNASVSFPKSQAWTRQGKHYFKIKNDGTNFTFSYSRDGAQYWTFFTEAVNAYLTTPDQIGIATDCFTASQTMVVSVDWIRRTL